MVCAIRYLGFLFHTPPTGVVAEPQEVAVFIGHFTRDTDLVAVEVVEVVDLLAAFASEGVAFAVAVVYEFAVFVETVYFRPPQCVGNDGMVFAVVERPFFVEVVAAFEHFVVDVVTVVFVAGYQSVGLVVFDHDVVAVGETAQFFAVASVNGGQIAVAVVVVAHQFLAVEGDGSEAVRRRRERRFSRGRLKVGFQTTSMLTANKIVKKQMVQTTSKKVKSSK